MEVPSIGSPEEDPKTVELKLRQVQKEKGTMKVRLLANTHHVEGRCSVVCPCLLSMSWHCVRTARQASRT